jgi:pyridoxal 5'-phosphate synthase pdxT subunit
MGAGPIGVLALQGGFEAHARALGALGHRVRLVRTAGDLSGCVGLVLPGGESTVQWKLLDREGLEGSLAELAAASKPVLATCAGLILAAARVLDPEQRSLGWIDVTVRRNAWGRQLSSFEDRDDSGAIPVVAIRAPRIVEVGPRAQVLATLRGEPILVRQGHVTGATFHPELTDHLGVHAAVFGGAPEARARSAPERAPGHAAP